MHTLMYISLSIYTVYKYICSFFFLFSPGWCFLRGTHLSEGHIFQTFQMYAASLPREH